MIIDLGEDIVRVVRCKDCMRRHSSEYCECRPDDAYCSDGEMTISHHMELTRDFAGKQYGTYCGNCMHYIHVNNWCKAKKSTVDSYMSVKYRCTDWEEKNDD